MSITLLYDTYEDSASSSHLCGKEMPYSLGNWNHNGISVGNKKYSVSFHRRA